MKLETENILKELKITTDDIIKRSMIYPSDEHLQIMELISNCALQLGLILQNIERKQEWYEKY